MHYGCRGSFNRLANCYSNDSNQFNSHCYDTKKRIPMQESVFKKDEEKKKQVTRQKLLHEDRDLHCDRHEYRCSSANQSHRSSYRTWHYHPHRELIIV